MTIVGGFDVHRAQITFDYLDLETGEMWTGRIAPADRDALAAWLRQRFAGEKAVAFAVEGCTGWRYVVEELELAGIEAHLAEPADTAALRSPKRRAKTDKADARHLRQLLMEGRLPEAWVAPSNVLEIRALGRLYIDLLEERRSWQQRVRAQLYHQGVPAQSEVFGPAGRKELAQAALSPAGAQSVATGLSMIDALNDQLNPLGAQLGESAGRQVGCRAANGPLWGGSFDGSYRVGRDGRLPPILVLWPRGAPHRARRDGVLLGWQAHSGPPCPPRPAGAALGPIRSRPVRGSQLLARP